MCRGNVDLPCISYLNTQNLGFLHRVLENFRFASSHISLMGRRGKTMRAVQFMYLLPLIELILNGDI
jgi:hypothetical protein